MVAALESFRANVLIFSSAMRVDIRKLVEQAKQIKTRLVLVIESGDSSAQYIQVGIGGVVFRNVSGTALVECVRKVAKGETWVQDTGAAAEANENDVVGARVRDRLTPKELKIVALIVQGFKNKEIATQLGTTEQVIKNYLRNVYDKIGVSDRLELALFTIHHRILAEAAAALAGTVNTASN
jgi:DNA-binding NarL/FixJ family response regulator